MRYRLTVISAIGAALAVAVILFALDNGSSDPVPERSQTELFPEGLGIVAAFTATAQAGGAALDPTAIATPTATSVSVRSTPEPSATAVEATEIVAGSLSVRVSGGQATAGEPVSLEVTGATPGETFEVEIDGEVVATGNAVADGTGSVRIEVTIPAGVSEQSVELSISGSISGTISTSLTISASGPADGTEQPNDDDSSEELVAAGPGDQASGGDIGSQMPSPADTENESADMSPATTAGGNSIPGWALIVLGLLTGWLMILTLWVYRLDRDRDAQYKFLQNIISQLVADKTSTRQTGSEAEPSASDQDSRAA